MNLILFSGGVESTLLLQKATSDDLIVSIDGIYGNEKTYTNGGQKILDYYCLRRKIVSVDIPYTSSGVHQLKYFIPIIMLIANTFPIKKVLIGRNKEDINDRVLKIVEEGQRSINCIFPDIVIDHPFDYLTKQEQWDRIPVEIQRYVSSCVNDINGGDCFKCKEKIYLISPKGL